MKVTDGIKDLWPAGFKINKQSAHYKSSYISAPQKEESLQSELKSASTAQREVVLLNNSNRTGILPHESTKPRKEHLNYISKLKFAEYNTWRKKCRVKKPV